LIKNLKLKIKNSQRGFTLIEIVVAVCILAILAFSVSRFFISMINGISYYRERTTISSLANQYLEIARNLPYSEVGTVSGVPHGSLPDNGNDGANALIVNFGGTNYKIYYVVRLIDDPADGTIGGGGVDYDPASNDYKQIKLYIQNTVSGATNDFLTNISPKGLEDVGSGGGALYIHVTDAGAENGVENATVRITNVAEGIDLPNRLTDENGYLTEVGLPAAVGYHVVVTKNGYSTDQTYPSTEQNPNPIKADANIQNGAVTPLTFEIDLMSTLSFHTEDQSCSTMGLVGVEVSGSKLIGLDPNVLKFYGFYTSNSSGNVSPFSIEYDSYTITPTNPSYILYGSSPAEPGFVYPGESQNFNLMIGPKGATDNSFLVLVEDNATKNPIQGAEVVLHDNSSGEDTIKFTGGSVFSQSDWTGDPGQMDFIDPTRYFSDDGYIDRNSVPAGLRLSEIGPDSYSLSGSLESSTFDTGTDTPSYINITWQPTDPGIKFQVAVSSCSNGATDPDEDPACTTDPGSWNFTGPDGTAGTYYTSPGMINSVNNKRYFRYKVFLSGDGSSTPVLSSVSVNYISECSTPGQVIFIGLSSADNNYQLTATASGYGEQSFSDLKISGYNVKIIYLDSN